MIKIKGKIGDTTWREKAFALIWTIYAICRWGLNGAEKRILDMKQKILREIYRP